ncbi:hypothetical protein [uncultured Chryseobacterium sp.]|uniref:hypothetical protein n=1 Tax=uncultured Chryseobacterium sp. TaxID=259322 RepID=UPI0025EBE18A|nr:hypothetical protein [uncultured Chryseobacterium sp.]
MKKGIILMAILGLSSQVQAQIGIGTTTPAQKLDVVGSTAVKSSVFLDPVDYVNNPSGFTILGTDPQSGVVNGKVLAVENLYTPLTIQPYSVTNIYRDDLTDLNLNISTDNFFITVANFEAIPSSGNNGIYTDTSANPVNKGHFVFNIFESGGTWHINISYPTLNTQNTTDRYTYNFDVVMYSKRFYKNLGTVTYDLGGSNNGSAPAAPSGI